MKKRSVVTVFLVFGAALVLASLVGCGSGGGDGSSIVTPLAPIAPSDISATMVTKTSARLSWTDNSDDEDGFQIGTCGGTEDMDAVGAYCSGGWASQEQTIVNFYDFTNLTPGTDYTYYIRSYNSSGASNAYRVDFTTEPLAIPAAPSGIAASLVTESSARLSWVDNADNEDGFQIGTCSGAVESDADGTYCADGWTLVAEGVLSPYDLSGLTPDTDYAYYLRAYNADGESHAYQVLFTTLSGVVGAVPSAPLAIEATLVATDSARLSWTDNSDNEDGFQIGTCGGADATDGGGTYCAENWTFVVETADTFYDLDSLTSGTDYSYYVRAYNAIGASNAYRVDFTTSSLATFYPDLDNTITDLQPTTAIATNDGLGVGCVWQEDDSNTVSGGCVASLVHYDLSLLAGRTIQSATLQLAVAYLGEPSLAGELTLARDWAVTPVGETIWDETVTWSDAESLLLFRIADGVVMNPPIQQFQSLAVDVTAFVQNWVEGTWSNNGIILRLTDESLPATVPEGINEDGWAFFSNDFSAEFGPRLTVVYQ